MSFSNLLQLTETNAELDPKSELPIDNCGAQEPRQGTPQALRPSSASWSSRYVPSSADDAHWLQLHLVSSLQYQYASNTDAPAPLAHRHRFACT